MFGLTNFFDHELLRSAHPTLFLAGALSVATLGAITDLWRGKIYNWLTMPAMLLGLLASSGFYGWSGGLSSLLGIGLGFLLYGVLYALGAMAAGDVKLLMALGAWGAPSSVAASTRFVCDAAIVGVVLGGVFALFSLVATKRLAPFARKLWRFLLSSALAATDDNFEVERPRLDASATIPFGLPLALGAAWVVLADPLLRAGFGP